MRKISTIIISLGGSVIIQDTINIPFLKAFKELMLRRTARFIIVAGGGKVCRMYQDAACMLGGQRENIDWIGIAATRTNAELLRSLFGDKAYDDIAINPTRKAITDKRIIIAAGWKPGCSTDHDAVLLAKTYGSSTVINVTNVDWLYDKNPKEKGAQRIERTDWSRLQQLVGTTWKPGLHAPFDPIATAFGAKLHLRLILVGSDLKNLENVLDKQKFNGTIVQ